MWWIPLALWRGPTPGKKRIPGTWRFRSTSPRRRPAPPRQSTTLIHHCQLESGLPLVGLAQERTSLNPQRFPLPPHSNTHGASLRTRLGPPCESSGGCGHRLCVEQPTWPGSFRRRTSAPVHRNTTLLSVRSRTTERRGSTHSGARTPHKNLLNAPPHTGGRIAPHSNPQLRGRSSTTLTGPQTWATLRGGAWTTPRLMLHNLQEAHLSTLADSPRRGCAP